MMMASHTKARRRAERKKQRIDDHQHPLKLQPAKRRVGQGSGSDLGHA